MSWVASRVSTRYAVPKALTRTYMPCRDPKPSPLGLIRAALEAVDDDTRIPAESPLPFRELSFHRVFITVDLDVNS